MTVENMTIASNNDDATDDGTTKDVTTSYPTMGFTGGKVETSGWRFVPGTAIPAGATITAVDFQYYQAASPTGNPVIRVKFEHEANPADFTTGSMPSARAATTNYYDYSPGTGTGYKSLNTQQMIDALQEVVNAHGPLSAINVICGDNTGTGENYVQGYSHDFNDAGKYATLSVTYTPAATGGWLKYRHI